MRNNFKVSILISVLTLVSCFCGQSQQATAISVLSNKPGVDVQPTMWGVFFEDINFAADGGIYAELVKNGSFEFSLPITGWRLLSRQNGTGRMVPNFYSPARPANPHFIRIYIDPASYAPLLAHVDAWQWRPDLIRFDNLTTMGTPN